MTRLELTFTPEGVAIICLNRTGAKNNLITQGLLTELAPVLQQIDENPAIKAAVITSAKKDFATGLDLKAVLGLTEWGVAESICRQAHRLLTQMETGAKPLVAAISGAATGAGLELALACHYRLATTEPHTVFAFPDIKLGLIPAGGATQRLPKLVGMRHAVYMLLYGKNIHAYKALKIGLVNRLTHPTRLMHVAIQTALALANHKSFHQKEPASIDRLLRLNRFMRDAYFDRIRQKLQQTTFGNYPAPFKALECIDIGCRYGAKVGYAAEMVKFDELAVHPATKNLLRIHFNIQQKKQTDSLANQALTVAVLGAGFMGGGIAQVSLLSGLKVILSDVDTAKTAHTLQAIWHKLSLKVKRRAISPINRWEVMNRINTQPHYQHLQTAQFIIEAVYEDLPLKQQVLQNCESYLQNGCIYASNTSAIPIQEIARYSNFKEQVIGLHYFSPVTKMQLLEIITTPQTPDWVTQAALQLGSRQGKTCMVVKDSPGFYTTRIMAAYLNEALLMLQEGADVWHIDQAAMQLGFPIGPFSLMDEIGIASLNMVLQGHLFEFFAQTRGKDAFTPSFVPQKMLHHGLEGKKNQTGFYRYHPKTKQKISIQPNPQVYKLAGTFNKIQWFKDKIVRQRLIMLMANEAARCVEEGIVASATDADLGAVLGLGFPAFTGGPLRYLQAIGAEKATARLYDLSQKLGNRFLPANLSFVLQKNETNRV